MKRKSIFKFISFLLTALIIVASFLSTDAEAASKKTLKYYDNSNFWTASDDNFIYIQGEAIKLTRISRETGKKVKFGTDVDKENGKYIQVYDKYLYYISKLKTKGKKYSQNVIRVDLETGERTVLYKVNKKGSQGSMGDVLKALKVNEEGVFFTYSTYKHVTRRVNGVRFTDTKESKAVYHIAPDSTKAKKIKTVKFKAEKNLHPVKSKLASMTGNGKKENNKWELKRSLNRIVYKNTTFKLKLKNTETAETETIKVKGCKVEYSVEADFAVVFLTNQKVTSKNATFVYTLYVQKAGSGELTKVCNVKL